MASLQHTDFTYLLLGSIGNRSQCCAHDSRAQICTTPQLHIFRGLLRQVPGRAGVMAQKVRCSQTAQTRRPEFRPHGMLVLGRRDRRIPRHRLASQSSQLVSSGFSERSRLKDRVGTVRWYSY